MGILLHDLAGIDDRRLSPFCWRIKFALAHKGLAFKAQPVGFSEIPAVCGAGHKTVPILQDGDRAICDSWAIADYLDEAYPERPRIFASPAERGLCGFLEAWVFSSLFPHLFPMYAKDIHDHVREDERAYFRETREQWLGRSLEDASAGREGRLEAVRESLAPVRLTLTVKKQRFLSGEEPGYADYLVAGILLWVAVVGTLPLLQPEDPVALWFERVRDLHGGLGRTCPAYPIVG